MLKDMTSDTRETAVVDEHSDWQDRFREIYHAAVEAYELGRSGGPDGLVAPESKAFLESIGMKPRELYDFVEDWCDMGEPTIGTVLAITAVRREYFLLEQQGKALPVVPAVDSYPSGWARVGGFGWLPRIIAKGRAKLRGELPPDLMFGCGADRPFLRKVRIEPAEFLRLVWAAGDDAQQIVEQVGKASRSEPPSSER